MSNFTPVSGLIGGSLIGAAAVLALGVLGRIAGVSNIAHGTLAGPAQDESLADWAWRPAFLAGLVAAGALYAHLWPTPASAVGSPHTLQLILGGLLVGWGTAQGRGCTSGHGVCGLARLSWRSLVATLAFMATGVLTVGLMRHVLHGP